MAYFFRKSCQLFVCCYENSIFTNIKTNCSISERIIDDIIVCCREKKHKSNDNKPVKASFANTEIMEQTHKESFAKMGKSLKENVKRCEKVPKRY